MHRRWVPSLLKLRDSEGNRVSDEDCPVAYAIKGGTQSLHRMMIKGRRSSVINVDIHIIPIVNVDGRQLGATITLADASPEADLEERVQSLHERATRDPLTGISNRAEFDMALEEAVASAIDGEMDCSLIICDIDHFKKINDTYGHQAGDDVLIQFAALLQRSSRQSDLVARYGGEEFVIICKNCTAPAASELAEKIRSDLARMPMEAIHKNKITSSFGVTQLQLGDAAETMLRRADRALYQAKDSGRNRVIELGSGMQEEEETEKQSWWSSFINSVNPTQPTDEIASCKLSTNVPVNIAAQKLRGFVADHEATIEKIEENRVTLRAKHQERKGRRNGDRDITFLVELNFQDGPSDTKSVVPRNFITVKIRSTQRTRDRRETVEDAARALINSLRAYLMAEYCDPSDEK